MFSSLTYFIIVLILIDVSYGRRAQSKKMSIGRLIPYAHGVKASEVILLDTKRIQIKNFYYDGRGPDAYFSVGKKQGALSEYEDLTANTKLANENGKCSVIKGYRGRDVTLTLPDNMTVNDVEHLAAYCFSYRHNFAYIRMPKNLTLTPSDLKGVKACK